MNNELYRAVIIPARESPDGESPAVLIVTQEVNGYALWYADFDDMRCLRHEVYVTRDAFIESAVREADQRRANLAKAKEVA